MINDFKIEAFSRPVSDLADRPVLSAGELKEHFDSNSYELLAALNGLIEYFSGDDALSELKAGGKSIAELLSLKVDKQEGKVLSDKNFTEEEKEKLSGLSNYDDTAVLSAVSGKVDKEEGKGLSANDYTTDEKNKLAGLKNYDDSAILAAIKNIEALLKNKVEKEEGKGLSSNDYTDEEKNKIRLVWYYEIDEGIEDGLYFVMEEAPDDEGGYGDGYLVIQTHYNSGEEFVYTQIKYDTFGTYKRISYGDNSNFGAWEKTSDEIDVIDNLTSISTDNPLSANMGRELNEKVNELKDVSLKFKGEVEEDALPAENNATGDVYKTNCAVTASITKEYVSGELYYDENTAMYYLSIGYEGLYTEDEYDSYYNDTSYEANYNTYIGPRISCDIYDSDWNYITTTKSGYRDDCGGWNIDTDIAEQLMTTGSKYYLVRTNAIDESEEYKDTSLQTHEFTETAYEYECYSIYNGTAFDKLYTAETVDEKIGDTETALNEKIGDIETALDAVNENKADADNWEHIDTVTTSEDLTVLDIYKEPDGTLYDFKKLKIIVSLPSGGSGNAYFNVFKRGGGSASSVSYILLSHTRAYAEYYIEGGYAWVKTYSGTGEYSQFHNTASPVALDTIDNVRINGNGTILTGTKFEIWGVRA